MQIVNLRSIVFTTLTVTLALGQESTLLVNAHLYRHPEADAILCIGGKIQAIGRREDFSADRVVDLKGGYLYPGFSDAHLHLAGLGWSLETLNLVGTASAEEIITLVRQAVEETERDFVKGQPGFWIQGRGWDQNDWEVKEYPTKALLDTTAPDQPVFLRRIDGHAAWVNSRALEQAGITKATPDPAGGRIIRDAEGEPTGILIDRAMGLVSKHIPPTDRVDRRRYILKAVRKLNALGITSVHDAGSEAETIQVLRDLADEEHLTLRVYALLQDDPEDYQPFLSSGPQTADPTLQVRALKLYLDGALGSRGAALLEPYADDPSNRGLILTDSAVIHTKVRQFNRAGFQVGIHCIGDRAVRMALDIFEQVQAQVPGEHRNRIEHAQIIHPRDLPRFAALEVIPSMQATHCTSDMYWADERLGPDRLMEAYPWHSLLETGAIIPGGSDAPVEDPDPLKGIYAAVTRQDPNGWPEGGWLPGERLNIDEALKMVTEWPAWASFEEDRKGRLEPGYYADFSVLSNPLESSPPEVILTTEVLFTIVNGRVVYSR